MRDEGLQCNAMEDGLRDDRYMMEMRWRREIRYGGYPLEMEAWRIDMADERWLLGDEMNLEN